MEWINEPQRNLYQDGGASPDTCWVEICGPFCFVRCNGLFG